MISSVQIRFKVVRLKRKLEKGGTCQKLITVNIQTVNRMKSQKKECAVRTI